jgi:hypothetical protein
VLVFLFIGVGVAGLPHPTLGLGNSLLCWFRLFCGCCWGGESGIFACKLCWDGWDGMGKYVESFLFLPMQEQLCEYLVGTHLRLLMHTSPNFEPLPNSGVIWLKSLEPIVL